MQPRQHWAFAASLILCLACDAPEEPAGSAPGAAARAEAPAGLADRPVPAASADLPSIPALEGLNPQGALDVNGAGVFVPSKGAIDFFEYYLDVAEHEPVERVRPHIEAAIRSQLESPEPALLLLSQYLGYREALGASDLSELTLAERLVAVQGLRREHFGAEVATEIFAAEEERARFEIAWRRIADDESLTPEERARQLDALEEQLPGPVRLRRKLARAALRLDEEEASLRAQGVSEEEIQARREERFGRTASDRVERMRASRAEWEARLRVWRSERDVLLVELADRDPAERDAALRSLREEHFEPREWNRVEALERAGAGDS